MNDHHVAGGDEKDVEDNYQVRYGDNNSDDEVDDGEMDHNPQLRIATFFTIGRSAKERFGPCVEIPLK